MCIRDSTLPDHFRRSARVGYVDKRLCVLFSVDNNTGGDTTYFIKIHDYMVLRGSVSFRRKIYDVVNRFHKLHLLNLEDCLRSDENIAAGEYIINRIHHLYKDGTMLVSWVGYETDELHTKANRISTEGHDELVNDYLASIETAKRVKFIK